MYGSSLVSKIDSELEFVQDLGKAVPCSTSVYQVFSNQFSANKSSYVLKIASFDDKKMTNHILNEEKILIKASEIDGISHLIKKYENNGYIALLKEYFDGYNLKSSKKKLNSIPLQQSLQKTLFQLNNLGVVGIDLFSQNIVVAYDNSYVKIVDLGDAYFSKYLTKNELKEKLDEDKLLLKRLFS